MKVLLVNTNHALGGGANTVYFNTGEMLRQAGVNVICFALHSPEEVPCEQSAFFAKTISQNAPLDYIRKRLYNKDAARCLQRLIDAEHPDIAQVHLIWGGLAPSILDVLRNNKIPVVHVVHDYAMICSLVTLRGNDGKPCELCANGCHFQSVKTRCHKGSWIRSFIASTEIFYRNKKHHPVDLIDHFMFVSHFCARKHGEMDSRYKNASQSVLYNVPDKAVACIASEPIPDTYDSYYLYYGRLSYEKGLGTLIEAFAENPSIQLKVVGTGPLEEALKEKCHLLGANNISFLGFKKGEELYRIVRNAKFVCVPSEWYENNPMTIIEAYTLGTPVIAARIGGIPEIVIEDKTGFLFESGSQNGLYEVLQKVDTMKKENYINMKKASALFSQDNFDRERYLKEILLMFNRVIDKY